MIIKFIKKLLCLVLLSVLFIACGNKNQNNTSTQSQSTRTICNYCNGTGQIYCNSCNGYGIVNAPVLDPYSGMVMSVSQTCMNCKGTGVVKCMVCGGNGFIVSFKGSHHCRKCNCESFSGYGKYCSRCNHSWDDHNYWN